MAANLLERLLVVVSYSTMLVSVAAATPRPRPGVCEREAPKLAGDTPARIGSKIHEPKRIRHVFPKYPTPPDGTVGSGSWMGEVLVDRSGKVARVWPLREVKFNPPFPAFNRAISDAIQQWEYEPLLVRGRPAPFCMVVTVTIDWQ